MALQNPCKDVDARMPRYPWKLWLIKYECSKCQLHNNISKCIYPVPLRFSWLLMSTHGYNPVNYNATTTRGLILLVIGVSTVTCNWSSSKFHTGTQAQLSNKLFSKFLMSHRDTSVAIKQAQNRSILNPEVQSQPYVSTRTQLAIKQAHNWSVPNAEVQSQSVCFNEDTITLHCNQSGVSILTDVF